MAEILLTAVINVLFQEGTRLYWLKEDIDWLQREMRHIRSYVDNAKAKEAGGDSRVKNLLKDIQQLADEFAMEIEKIKRRVIDIDRIRTTYNIIDTNNNNDDCVLSDRRRLFLRADETEVIGLDDDFNMLQAKLLDQDLHYGVVSIVGMPGLGKTTLAKKLYRLVRDQFECSGLVYVSQQPRAGEILLDIAKQVGLTEKKRKENLEDNLRSLLKIKRYNEEKMDLSGEANGYSFPQLEVLHIHYPKGLSEVTCTDDVSMLKLKELLLTGVNSPISLSGRLKKPSI